MNIPRASRRNPAPGITPEQARDIRAHAWVFIFRCHEMKKATRPGGPDARKESNGSSKVSIP